MTTKSAEGKEAEYANQWKITAFKEFGFKQIELPAEVIEDIKYRLKTAFLAGRESMRKKMQELVNKQAEDPGLWFDAQTAPEAYLQQELRKLHAAIEMKVEVEK